jgi:glycerate kinase
MITTLPRITGPMGSIVEAFYGVLPHDSGTHTAVIEIAAAAGLSLVPVEKRDPAMTTTYGVGELIKAAIVEGIRDFIIGIGGSATNDCGCGMMQALGVRFLDFNACELKSPLTGGMLGQVGSIDLSGINPALRDSTFVIACDVENPLLGPRGATYMYAGQKGADDAAKVLLEANMCHIIELIEQAAGRTVRNNSGAGAAGGIGAALMAFLDAVKRPGIDLVMSYTGFRKHLSGADLVITGEGCFDRTSSYGKVVAGVAQEAMKLSIPVVVIAGGIGEGADIMNNRGVTAYFSICSRPMSLEQAQKNAVPLISTTAEQIVRLLLPSKK